MGSSSSGQQVVDIDKLSASTEEKLQMPTALSSECCIYRVPHLMRVSNEQLFTPQIVSIGPIHYQNKKLRANEHLKEKYLAEFRQHTGVSLNKCYKLILDNETRLRNCYADVVKLESETFVRMILVDAAFLIMTLVYSSCQTLISSTDRLFKKPAMIWDIRFDLMLLENQLPFFILEDLYKLSKFQNIVERESMTVFAYHFLEVFLTWSNFCRHPPSKPEHILDLYKICLIPAGWDRELHEIETRNIPSLKKLYQAGVKIQVGEGSMFDISFNKNDGILKIPQLYIHDFTEMLFRNLLAYELCQNRERIFADYFEMMRLLTLSPEDTELLVQNRVIINLLPNAERVSTQFQNIIIGNVFYWYAFRYGDVIKDLNEHYKDDWNKWKATLKEKYFKAPWAICSVSLAVVLLVLTIVQTVFTILQVVLSK